MSVFDQPMVQSARGMAAYYHGLKHQFYNSAPYTYHLDAVAKIVEKYGEDAVILAYLHDLFEDTDAPEEVVKETFGDFIFHGVCLLTDPPGKNRKERKVNLYERLSLINWHDFGENYLKYTIILVVKAADRLANTSHSVITKNPKLEMYKNEYPEFKKAIYRPALCDDIWKQLDRLMGVEPSPVIPKGILDLGT
jgi:guanosine-3',5'-bis(diphosphate) 3'-pyrophosphohydrolase